MSFLAPLFLLGAAAIALPVVLHLIRRSSRERVPFSSLMFLLPTPPRVTRRSKLENLLLLALRCLVLGLLAFAFARPFFSKPMAPDPTGQAGQKTVVLIDTSASMRRGNLWPEAKARAQAIIEKAGAADQVACLTFDREVRPVVTFEEWLAMPIGDRSLLTNQRLDGANPSWGTTRLGAALTTACEMFEVGSKNEQAPKHIVVISDLQEGSRLDGLQGFEWPKGVSVTIESLVVQRTSNAGLQLALDRDELTPGTAELATRVRLSNSSDAKREQFQLGWKQPGQSGYTGPTVDVYIPPGQNRVIPIQRTTNDLATDRIVAAGDDEDFDNTVYVVPPKAERSLILFLSSDSETDAAQSLYYVRRAFQQTRNLTAEVVARAPGAALTEQDLASTDLMILNDALADEQIRTVRSFLEGGKTVLVTLAKITTAPTLGKLLGQEGFGADEVESPTYAMLGQIDFEHPLFAPFADPRYSDFTKIHFWKHRRVPLEKVARNRILARFDDGDPALAEIPIGKGRLWVLTSGWQPADSQLALSSKFVPLLYAMLEQSGGVKEQRGHYFVGDEISLPVSTDVVTVRKPDASEVKVARGERFTAADQPGVYRAVAGEQTVTFAVNLAPEESKTAPLPVEDLARLGVPLQPQITGSPQALKQHREFLHALELESRQKLWRWLIVAALVVLVMETWLAGRATRSVVPMPETR